MVPARSDYNPISSTNPETQIGLIGVGAWGRLILRDLCALGCSVHAVVRGDSSMDGHIAMGAASVATDVSALPPVDGIVIATPSTTHGEVIRAVVDRGVPVFVEKPMVTTFADATWIVEHLGDRLFVMDKWRYHAGVLALRDLARSGTLGSIVGLRTRRMSTGSPHPDVDPIWILAPHDLSIAIEVLGDIPEPVAAVADRNETGIVGLHGLLGVSPWMSLEVSGRNECHLRDVRLYGTEGTATLADAYSDHIAILRGTEASQVARRDVELVPIAGEMPLLAELRAFVEYLHGGPPPKSSATEGACVVRTIARLRSLAGITGEGI